MNENLNLQSWDKQGCSEGDGGSDILYTTSCTEGLDLWVKRYESLVELLSIS